MALNNGFILQPRHQNYIIEQYSFEPMEYLTQDQRNRLRVMWVEELVSDLTIRSVSMESHWIDEEMTTREFFSWCNDEANVAHARDRASYIVPLSNSYPIVHVPLHDVNASALLFGTKTRQMVHLFGQGFRSRLHQQYPHFLPRIILPVVGQVCSVSRTIYRTASRTAYRTAVRTVSRICY